MGRWVKPAKINMRALNDKVDVNYRQAAEIEWLNSSGQRSPEATPFVTDQLLQTVFESLSGADVRLALQEGLVPIAWLPYQVFYARREGHASPDPSRVVAKITSASFDDAVLRVFSKRLAHVAAYGLAKTMPMLSARRRLTSTQALCLGLVILALAAGLVLLPAAFRVHFFGFGFSIFFGLMIWLRVVALQEPYIPQRQIAERDDRKLPVYSVLVPVFRETAVLPQLLAALKSLSYPAHKLDIKLILEESDVAMQRALAAQILPSHFQVLVVPRGRPQTKPRALNYALNFARGSLVTIYDAEDIPEPMQLRMAAKAFADLPETTACLQAELSFYNPNENWLTRQFTAEYATLFKLILPALSANQLPVPLGGTSNHFRKSVLLDVGGWDAHNVTEDADLGFRLARFGYHCSMLNSTTFEEANTDLRNWLLQRARWFKGFLQTWLVHMRKPSKLLHEIGFAGFMTLLASILGVVISAALYPLFLISTVSQIFTTLILTNPMVNSWAIFAEAIYVGQFIVGTGVMIFSSAEALRRKRFSGWWLTLATLPIYWLLASIAAWLAIWQLITNPFQWNKTRHGLSRLASSQIVKLPISNASQ